MSASGWREFWRVRGMRELQLVLWASWDPILGDDVDPERDSYAAQTIADWFAHTVRTQDW